MSTLPASVLVRELLPEGVHYVLPPRTLGGDTVRRRVKGFFIAGILGTLVCAAWGAILIWRDFASGGRIASAVMHAMEFAPFVFIGFVAIGFTSFLLWGHAEIKLHGGKLLAIERAGLLRWTWRRNIEQIHILQIVPGLSSSSNESASAGPNDDCYRISAGDMFLAAGYPKELCTAIANDLQRRWPKEIADEPEVGRPEVSQPEAAPPVRAEIVDRFEQPAGSRIVATSSADGSLVVQIPASGIWNGSKGLFSFALFWNGCLALVTVVMILVFSAAPGFSHPIMVLALTGFWIIGILVLYGAIRMGRRRTAIAVAGERMMVVERFLFRNRTHEWTRDKLARVVCGPSAIKVGDESVMELQVWPTEQEKFSMLTGRDQAELEWIATLVRQHLNLAPQSESDAAEPAAV